MSAYIRRPSQLQKLIEETGLSKSQIMNYSGWLKNAGIFPSHKEARDVYSPEERATLRKIGDYLKSGEQGLDSVRSAVRDVFGAPKVADFGNWWKEYLRRRPKEDLERKIIRRLHQIEEDFPTNLTPLAYNALVRIYDDKVFRLLSNVHHSILDRLVEEFLRTRRKMIRSYPLNLYFAVSGIEPESFIKNKIDNLMCSTPEQRNFEDYRSYVFGKFIQTLEEFSNRILEPFETMLSAITTPDKQQTEGLKRSIEIVRARYIKMGKLRTMEEVGTEYGITRERVRQLEERALRLLRSNDKIKVLTEELFHLTRY